ncbi:Ankyrin repeat-containing protein [Thalictrum thalictroides]|uniref:Ankyrin repeat-containing protein n=1 Tax=Thalictrum thalictroides TaxID=46969 RepID=A0A7J6VF93_THATH|nr:Ankyrin repeat-containing protein [Thalictrum thalictroides]
MASIDLLKYGHSPVDKAIATKVYATLKRILVGLPRLCNPPEIHTKATSVAEEQKADFISVVIDWRDVPNRETSLHLAVKLGDETATEMLMVAGAINWSLKNEQGWSALQEAICNREENIAMIIARHYQPLAWAKWCRRLPHLIGTIRRMKDFYMEITFHSWIAPSDTYKIGIKFKSLQLPSSSTYVHLINSHRRLRRFSYLSSLASSSFDTRTFPKQRTMLPTPVSHNSHKEGAATATHG